MATAAIDTLQTANVIEEAGLERGPAEAIARAIYQRGADYATRSDIDRLEASTKADTDRLEAAILALTGDVRRLYTAVLAASGGIIAALIAGIVAIIVAV